MNQKIEPMTFSKYWSTRRKVGKPKDLTGQRYGMLTVSNLTGSKFGDLYWACHCDCGNTKEVKGSFLTRGKTVTCGCQTYKIKDRTGKRYGRLTVVSIAQKAPVKWTCRCDCGATTEVSASNLGKHTLSCGCLKAENLTNHVQSQALPKGEAAFNTLFRSYQTGAVVRGLEFNLSKPMFRLLVEGCCTYCGASPSYTKRTKTDVYTYNGIDRKNSVDGYTPINAVTCCGVCNHAKRSMTVQEFLSWASRIHAHQLSATTQTPGTD